jgi:hypothetical protein
MESPKVRQQRRSMSATGTLKHKKDPADDVKLRPQFTKLAIKFVGVRTVMVDLECELTKLLPDVKRVLIVGKQPSVKKVAKTREWSSHLNEVSQWRPKDRVARYDWD